MGLQGTIKEFGLPDILQLVAAQNKTGVLYLMEEGETVPVFFQAGNIVAIGESNQMKSLLEVVLQEKDVPSEYVGDLIRLQESSGFDLAEVLLREGHVTREELETSIRGHIRDEIVRVLQWSGGSYQFRADGGKSPARILPVSVRTHEVLMQALTRLDELRELHSQFPSQACIPRRTTTCPPPEELDPLLRKAVNLVDNRRNVRETISEWPGSEFHILKALVRLRDEGFIELSSPPQAAPRHLTAVAPTRVAHEERRLLKRVALVLAASFATALVGLYFGSQHEVVNPLGTEIGSLRALRRAAEAELARNLYLEHTGKPAKDLETLVAAGLLSNLE